MVFGIGKELSVFVQAILSGNGVCLTYYSLRVFRRILKHNLWVIFFEDILFWVSTGIYLFVKIYKTSDGSIRWYFVVGVLVGGIITYFFMEKIMKKYVAKTKEKE